MTKWPRSSVSTPSCCEVERRAVVGPRSILVETIRQWGTGAPVVALTTIPVMLNGDDAGCEVWADAVMTSGAARASVRREARVRKERIMAATRSGEQRPRLEKTR